MDRFRNPFASALLGGLVVGGLGWIAIAAGWIHAADQGDGRFLSGAQPALDKPALGRSRGRGLTVNDIYRRDGPGVVFIQADTVQEATPSPFDLFPQPQRQRGASTGSGFVVDDGGYILTNAHVVAGATSIRVGLGGDKTYEARKIGQDASSDVALLRVKADKKLFHPLQLGDSGSVRVGDPVVAIGNPFGLDRTVTAGIVSARQRKIEAPNGFSINHVIQTDAPINPGNSGGPLLDTQGKVIGINSQIATAGGGGSIGIGFAVPIDTVRKVAEQLRREGSVTHAFLGITGAGLGGSVAQALNLPIDRGVLVQRVVKGGPAARAGVRGGHTQVQVGGQELVLGGDIIVEVDGKKVTKMERVAELVESRKPGDEMTLQLRRGGRTRTVKVKLGKRPQRLNQ